jgi:diguanylate cyclase (GGDEF)-like protein/PAS domain S-box-containing protein
MESVVLNATDAVLITVAEPIDSPGPTIVYVNPAFTRMTGYESADVVGKSPRLLQGPDSCTETRQRIRTALAAWQPVEAELLNYRKDGSTFWVELSIAPIADENGWFTHWVSIQRDVSERRTRDAAKKSLEAAKLHNRTLTLEIQEQKAVEERLSYVAFHDSLTGLYNRNYFMDQLRSTLVRVTRHEVTNCVLLYLDLDGFKTVNDTLGHKAGDELLVVIAQRLRRCGRSNDILARIGGDEFTLLLEGLSGGVGEAIEIAERVLNATQAPISLASTLFQVASSIGICPIHPRYAEADSILRDADLAMYSAKRGGGGRWAVYGETMHERALTELQRKIQLQAAVGNQEFELHYQPLVDLAEGGFYGVEALLRWRHPDRGLLFPGDFILLAEETGLIVPIGLWILYKACSDFAALRAAHNSVLCLSVNVSPRQLDEPMFLNDLLAVLSGTGMNPYELQLEITESIFLRDAVRIGSLFEEIRALGISIGFDDFGTGYSSLGYLEQYPIDTLKIDQSFVQHMGQNTAKASIVKMIVQLAFEMGITVSAEGVETREQELLLRACDCNKVQGFLYGHAVPLSEILVLLRSGLHVTNQAA